MMAKATYRAERRIKGLPGVATSATPGVVVVDDGFPGLAHLIACGSLTPIEEPPAPPKPIEKMNKVELIAFAAETLGVVLAEELTKAQMLAAIDEAIQAAEKAAGEGAPQ